MPIGINIGQRTENGSAHKHAYKVVPHNFLESAVSEFTALLLLVAHNGPAMLNTARHKDESSPGQQEGAAEVDGLTSGVQSVGRKVTACVCTIWLHTNNVEHNVVNATIDATCKKKRAVDKGDVLHQLELVWLSNDEKKKAAM
eukprot:CAMPEP_0172786222 /NCGR_PEP_ID=MMETSP1074-20121228/205841_1 /TAXON_ID=2916 /ORGANISM="Ceratium fusus, Strain PA161109" /LENGTH=142 /DNA_ID=CAMNT_0013623235 /DNA_START=206 /DNA_END=634 /DNA_ORIENTATION=+